ncbi:trna-splicing endonuclease subunit sen34 [Ophiostoma piceae UAMH 11346]|uniref:tRNA-splicing endonuclease subunit Sen34 n=1 Tax=Ophiostoma piceae (strain UAMH 11346) TaxID=1262450 RepID=S3CB98_OPHP1|nr:trna-splicing endonuclease subunit sen34 [Ophiostoma piceae UAMH 11346]
MDSSVAVVGAAGIPKTTDTSPSPSSPSPGKIRISKIGGRFLVFDVVDVARLRREQSMCSILVGITPQAPNQTVFSSLPLELTADEVRWLVYDRNAARVVDDFQEHLKSLASHSSRRSYTANVLGQRRVAQTVADEMAAERERRGAEVRASMAAKRAEKKSKKAVVEEAKEVASNPTTSTAIEVTKVDVATARKGKEETRQKTHQKEPLLRITPTTSAGLVGNGGGSEDSEVSLISRHSPASPSATALRAHLADQGYYTTPGLRFGGKLSVYPGDPFRYHAHFVATSYEWDEPICLLDVVGTGRLATGVKKGLLIGGAKPVDESPGKEGHEQRLADNVRTFTMEWAAI